MVRSDPSYEPVRTGSCVDSDHEGGNDHAGRVWVHDPRVARALLELREREALFIAEGRAAQWEWGRVPARFMKKPS